MDSNVITSDDLAQLRELLVEMASRWELLPIAMGVSMAEVDIIRLKHPQNPTLCLFEWLEQWVLTSSSPTFGTLLSVLRGKVAPNIPLADRVEEMVKRKATVPTVRSEPAALSPTPASPGSPSPVVVEAATLTHPQTPSSTEPATVAMKPKVLPHSSSPTTACDSTASEPASQPVLPEPCLAVSEATQQSTPATPPHPPVVQEAVAPTQSESTSSESKVHSQPSHAAACDSTTSSEPAAKKERPSFPLLPTGELTLHQREVLEGRLSLQSRRMLTQFGNMVFATCESLESRVEVNQLVRLLMVHTFEPLKEGVCTELQSTLLNIKSFNEFLFVIRPYYSFFDYYLIELLITTYGTDDDKRRLAEYEEQLAEFCKRRVYECPIEAFGTKGKFEICLVAKLKKEFEKFELTAVTRFRNKLCDILGVPDNVLRFIGAAEGCIEFHFAMMCFRESVIFPLSRRQRKTLQGEGVMELSGEIHHCNLQEERETTSEGGSTAENCSGDSEVEPDEDPLDTDICEAAESGDTATVTALLDGGTAIDTMGQWDATPLMRAAGEGNTATVQELLARGATINLKDKDGWTALHWAVRNGHTSTVEVLVAAGGDMSLPDKDGLTPLMEVASNGHTATVQWLCEKGAATNVQDEDGRTALYWAALNGHTSTVEVLVAAGEDVSLPAKDGLTPLMAAAIKGHTATVQWLYGKGAATNVQDEVGWTALHCAAFHGHTATAEVLVAVGAGFNIVTRAGQTPLMLAARWGYTATVQYLVSAGANVNKQDEDGRTALMQALQQKEFEAAEILIKAGAHLEHQEKATGWTALCFAAKEGGLPVVRLLLERGADPTVKDKEGVTAYDVAETYGHESVMKELEKYSATVPASEEPQSPTDPEPPTGTQPISPASSSAPAKAQQRTTIRARVFAAVRILAERMQELALPGRVKKREEGTSGPAPQQRSNKPRPWGRGRRMRRNHQKETVEFIGT